MNNFLFPPQIFLIFFIIDFLGDTCPNQLKNLVGHAFWVEVPFMAGCQEYRDPYWASSDGRIFSFIANLRIMAWQL